MNSAIPLWFCYHSQGEEMMINDVILCTDFVCFKFIRAQSNKSDSSIWCSIFQVIIITTEHICQIHMKVVDES